MSSVNRKNKFRRGPGGERYAGSDDDDDEDMWSGPPEHSSSSSSMCGSKRTIDDDSHGLPDYEDVEAEDASAPGMRTLQAKSSPIHVTVRGLRARVAELEAQLQDTEAAKNTQLARRDQTLAELDTEKEQLEVAFVEAEMEKEGLKSELAQWQQKLKLANQAHDAATSAKDAQLAEANQRADKHLNDLRNVGRQLPQLRAEKVHLEAHLEAQHKGHLQTKQDLSTQIQLLRGQVAALQQDVGFHKKRASDAVLEFQNANARASSCERRMNEVQEDLDKLRKDAQDQDRQLRGRADAEVQKRDAEIKVLRVQLGNAQAAQNALDNTRALFAEEQSRNTRVEQARVQLQAQLAGMTRERDEASGLSAGLRNLLLEREKQLGAAQKLAAEAERAGEAERRRAEDCERREKPLIEKNAEELENGRRRRETLENEVNMLRTNMSRVEQRAADLDEQLKAAERTATDLRKQLEASKEEAAEYKKQITKSAEEKDKQEKVLEDPTKQINEWKPKAEATQAEHRRQKADEARNQTEPSLAGLQKNPASQGLHHRARQTEATMTTLVDLEAAVQDTDLEVAESLPPSAEKECESLNADLSALKQQLQLNTANDENTTLKTRIASLEDLNTQLKTLEETSTTLNKQVEEFDGVQQQLNAAELEAVQTQLSTLEETNTSLSNQLKGFEELQQQLAASEKKNTHLSSRVAELEGVQTQLEASMSTNREQASKLEKTQKQLEAVQTQLDAEKNANLDLNARIEAGLADLQKQQLESETENAASKEQDAPPEHAERSDEEEADVLENGSSNREPTEPELRQKVQQLEKDTKDVTEEIDQLARCILSSSCVANLELSITPKPRTESTDLQAACSTIKQAALVVEQLQQKNKCLKTRVHQETTARKNAASFPGLGALPQIRDLHAKITGQAQLLHVQTKRLSQEMQRVSEQNRKLRAQKRRLEGQRKLVLEYQKRELAYQRRAWEHERWSAGDMEEGWEEMEMGTETEMGTGTEEMVVVGVNAGVKLLIDGLFSPLGIVVVLCFWSFLCVLPWCLRVLLTSAGDVGVRPRFG